MKYKPLVEFARAAKTASLHGNRLQRGKLKNRLQYVYSITVFMGVLSTAYLMMNKEGNANVPFRALQTPSYRMDAQVGNAALNQLFEMENKLSDLKASTPAKEDQKRLPTQLRLDKSK